MNRRQRYAGDQMRILREALKCVHGKVVLVTVTQPGEFDNASMGRRLRCLNSRIRAQMAREGLRPPRCVARVLQLQQRGAMHPHLIYLARTPDEDARVRRWVELYRQWAGEFSLGFVDDPYLPVHPKLNGRPDLSRPKRTREFLPAVRAAGYLSGYLGGGQFLALLEQVEDGLAVRPVWISPVLMRLSGWSLAACRMVRQGWLIANGRWRLGRPAWDRTPRTYPGWWRDPGQRAWVLAVLGSPG